MVMTRPFLGSLLNGLLYPPTLRRPTAYAAYLHATYARCCRLPHRFRCCLPRRGLPLFGCVVAGGTFCFTPLPYSTPCASQAPPPPAPIPPPPSSSVHSLTCGYGFCHLPSGRQRAGAHPHPPPPLRGRSLPPLAYPPLQRALITTHCLQFRRLR